MAVMLRCFGRGFLSSDRGSLGGCKTKKMKGTQRDPTLSSQTLMLCYNKESTPPPLFTYIVYKRMYSDHKQQAIFS